MQNDPVGHVDLWGLSASDSSRTTSINGKTYLTVNANDDQEFLDAADAYFGSLKYGTAGNIKVDGMALTNADGSVLHAFSTEEAIKQYYNSLSTDNGNTIESLTFPNACKLIGNTASLFGDISDYVVLFGLYTGNIPLAAIAKTTGKVMDVVSFSSELAYAFETDEWSGVAKQSTQWIVSTLISKGLDKEITANRVFQSTKNGGYYQKGHMGRLSDETGAYLMRIQTIKPELTQLFTKNIIDSAWQEKGIGDE